MHKEDFTSLPNEYAHFVTPAKESGAEKCLYCYNERLINVYGHNISNCLNRITDEENGICKLVCEECLSIGGYKCEECIGRQPKPSFRTYKYVVNEDVGLTRIDDALDDKTMVVKPNLYAKEVDDKDKPRCLYCLYSRNIEVRNGHNIRSCKNREFDEKEGICMLFCDKCGKVGNLECADCGGTGRYKPVVPTIPKKYLNDDMVNKLIDKNNEKWDSVSCSFAGIKKQASPGYFAAHVFEGYKNKSYDEKGRKITKQEREKERISSKFY